MPPKRVAVLSKHKDFAPIDTVREVTEEEARLLTFMGRAALVRGDESNKELKVPTRQIVPVTKKAHR